MEHDPRDRTISVDEAAAVLEIFPRQLRDWIARGISKPQRAGRDYVIRWRDIEPVWNELRCGRLRSRG
jgi:hypothetical protein